VPTRSESAANTRDALVAAAGELLDVGGPEAVTLRAVGARAGVSRGAPYGHFKDKEHLLTHLAAQAWRRLAEDLRLLQTDVPAAPAERLERALLVLVQLGRRQPHLYALMFRAPLGDVTELEAAVALSHGTFLTLVADVVGDEDAREYGALLLSSAHGVTAMELSGHLTKEKWGSSGDRIIARLVSAVRRT
jgi:AcrR family transcriptional regulator